MEGVFHVTDDVELIARTAVGMLEETPPLIECTAVQAHLAVLVAGTLFAWHRSMIRTSARGSSAR